MSGRVVVVGSVNVDLVVSVPTLPRPGETVTGGTFERHHGGKGANQAVAAARLGVPTAFVGLVGDDDLGAAARTALEQESIDLAGLGTASGVPTGVAVILVGGDGENLIGVAPGANADLTPDVVGSTLAALGLTASDVLLVSNEVPLDAVSAALDAGRTAGSRTVFNPAPVGALVAADLAGVNVLTPNRLELAALAASVDPPLGASVDPGLAARVVLERSPGEGVDAIVVTLGAAGALLVRRASDGSSVAKTVRARRVDAVDATGAGDAFNGCLAAALAEAHPLEDAVARAVVAGGLATTRVGARSGMPTRAELEAAIGG